jgi:site-specific DNA-cytosine methylase
MHPGEDCHSGTSPRNSAFHALPRYEIRKLSIAEIKVFASYLEEFRLMGSCRARWARIGNSVPPLPMKAIACHIRHRLFVSKWSAL